MRIEFLMNLTPLIGKFENGAMTGAFGYLFNCLAHQCNSSMYDPNDPATHISAPQGSPVQCNTSMEGCLATVRAALGCESAPGQGGCTGVGETRSYVLTGGNPITQYRPSEDVIINGTSPGHVFHDGYVIRWISVDGTGNVRVWSAGYGTNSSPFMSFMNRSLGNLLFSTLGHTNRDTVQTCLRWGKGAAACQ